MCNIDSTSYVEPGIEIPESCLVGPNTRLTGEITFGHAVKISANTIIWGPLELRSETYLGPNCLIGHPGKEGFGGALAGDRLDFSVQDKAVTIIGRNVVVRSNCTIYSGVRIEDNVILGHNVLLREGTRIGEGSLVGSNVVIDGRVRIGRGVSIQTGVYISPHSRIEDSVFLGPRCSLLNDKYLSRKETELVGPTVERGASIGGGAILLPRVIIGEDAVVAAGAVVTKDVKKRTVVAGVPARFLKPLPEDWNPL